MDRLLAIPDVIAVGMGLIFLVVVLFIFGTKADPKKTEEIKKLEKELSEDLKAAVIRQLNALAEAGQKFSKKKAFETLRTISIQESQKLRRKIVKLASLIRDPNNPKAPRKIKFDLKSDDVRAAIFAIVRQEGELSARAATLVNEQLELASRATSDYINSMLNTC